MTYAQVILLIVCLGACSALPRLLVISLDGKIERGRERHVEEADAALLKDFVMTI